MAEPLAPPPTLVANATAPGSVSLSELVEAEVIGLHESPPTVLTATGQHTLLTAKDVRLGRTASRRGDAEVAGAVLVRVGDVVVVRGPEPAVRVITEAGDVLGPGITLVRSDSRAIDPVFLAGVLRARLDSGDHDLLATSVPRIPLTAQRSCAQAFARLAEVEVEARRGLERVERIVRVGYGGLASGSLRPET
ncbi:hypothetical protein ACWEKT_01710 [Nocardia takedensis]